jgi:hypothetical protein
VRSALAAVVLCACNADGPAFRIDAIVTQQYVTVSAIERDPPRVCDEIPFPPLGVCDQTTDVIQCSGTPPADMFAAVRIERDGAVIATIPWLEASSTAGGWIELGDSAATLVIVADDGAESAVEIPATPRPTPTITGVTDLGDTVRVDWTATPPAASAIVGVGGGYGGPRCHLGADERPMLEWRYDSGSASVLAFAPPTEERTQFGDVHVWIGDGAEVSWP